MIVIFMERLGSGAFVGCSESITSVGGERELTFLERFFFFNVVSVGRGFLFLLVRLRFYCDTSWVFHMII